MFTQDELGLEPVQHYRDQAARYQALVEERRSGSDLAGLAEALLGSAWARERLGDGVSALQLADEARALLRSVGDLRAVCESCHTIAVWGFHTAVDHGSVADFTEAATGREELGELLLAAQSWHNLGYVQLIGGFEQEADRSYARARELLLRVEAEREPTAAASAFRQRGFVLSHVAFARARHAERNEALEATVAYFRHTRESGSPREPVLAHLAAGLALAGDAHPPPAAEALADLTGVPPDAETWLRLAVDEAHRALARHTPGDRRAYLGSHLLGLTELARWCAHHGRESEAKQLKAKAIARASARGWSGEADRVELALAPLL